MKTNARILSVLLIILILFTAGACGKGKDGEKEQAEPSSVALELPDGSTLTAQVVKGTVGDYTIAYTPKNFTFSSDMGSDTFTYTKWEGERNIYYTVYTRDMTPKELADGLVFQYSDNYESCYTEPAYIRDYNVTAVYLGRELGAPEYDLHFFIIECEQGCYVVETQLHTSMYGEQYVETRTLIGSILINGAVSAEDAVDNCPEPLSMVGKWERTHTMVEGYEEESAPDTCIITINGDSEEDLKITYTDKEFPDNSYKNKSMIISSRELHYNCGNDCWTADVDYVGRFDTTFALTLTSDGTLILQNYFLIDGAPMVSYEYFEQKN